MCGVHMQEIISTKSLKITIHENLDTRKLGAICIPTLKVKHPEIPTCKKINPQEGMKYYNTRVGPQMVPPS